MYINMQNQKFAKQSSRRNHKKKIEKWLFKGNLKSKTGFESH